MKTRVAVNPASKEHITGYKFGVLAAFAGVSCFLALVQIFCLYLGAFGIVLSRGFALLVFAVSVVLSLLFASRFRETADKEGCVFPAGGRSVRFINSIIRTSGFCVLLWAGWVWLQLWILVSLRPPYDWDGLYYHLPAIHAWVAAGHVHWIWMPPDIPYINYPMGLEVFSFFMHYLLGTSRFLNACNLWYWPLAFLSLVLIATRLGARGIWRWLAGALVFGAPVFVSQSASCYIDPGFSSTVMASAAAAAIFIFQSKPSPVWKAVLLGINVGLMAGSKGTGLPFAVVFLFAVLFSVFYIHGFDLWKTWLSRVFIFGLVAVVVGGFWYVRNTIHTGNPVHPLELKFGDRVLFEGYDYVLFTNANMPPWLEKYPPVTRMFVSWLQLDAPISGYAPTGGMGYIWLAGALPAFLYLWVLRVQQRKRSNVPIQELGFLFILFLLLLFVQPAKWWARFTVWLHALGLPCIAVVFSHAVSRWYIVKRHLFTIALSLGIISVAVWESRTTLKIEWKEGRNPRANNIREMFVTNYRYWFPAIEEIPGFERFFQAKKVGRSPMDGIGNLLGGILCLPLDRREIFVLPMEPVMEDITSLRNAGVEWIVWDVLSAGDVPEILESEALENFAFQPALDTNLHFIRI